MKKHYLLTIALLGMFLTSMAQTPCDQGRYSTELFPQVTTTSNVQFGQNTDFIGQNQTLSMDIYEPTGDTETARPLIIWAHGGSFIAGSKTDADVVTLSEAFARRGYVCASIDYRVGMWPIDSVNAVTAVVRAVQDMKAAVRYFYMDRATSDTYKIDTTRIIVGGSSAGAITALHLAYLDKDCEVEPYIPLSTMTALGGLEGTSGNPGYSSDVHGVINLCGALANYGWLEAGDIPFCSLHGDQDGTVPYGRGIASVSGFNIIHMDGSQMLKARAEAEGVQNNFYTHYDGDHAVYAFSAAYMDTTIEFVGDFLVDFLGCSEPVVRPENTPTGSAFLYPLTHCGLNTIEPGNITLEVYPNPAKNEFTVRYEQSESLTLNVMDNQGRLILREALYGTETTVNASEWKTGIYFIQLENEAGKPSIIEKLSITH